MTVVNDNASVYYQGRYWNDLGCVSRHINTQIGGGPDTPWPAHLADRHRGSFARALSLNCGNGWVERDLVERGLVAEAVGIDYSADLLAIAEHESRSRGLPIQYLQTDVNQAAFPIDDIDLVINHAAAHHIARIDRVFRHLCSGIRDDGLFVSFDYVGPHRNQYSYDAWTRAWALNESLPTHVRQEMAYPSLRAMLVDDPTEAVHSELIDTTLRRYFDIIEHVPLGGAIAYPLLTHNQKLFDLEDADEREHWAQIVLLADIEYLREHPESTLFAFYVAVPRKQSLEDAGLLDSWSAAEEAREQDALANGGLYYPLDPYQHALAALERLEYRATARRIRQVLSKPIVRKLRAQPQIHAIEQRARRRIGRNNH